MQNLEEAIRLIYEAEEDLVSDGYFNLSNNALGKLMKARKILSKLRK